MSDPIADGTASWAGGMDTSRKPTDITQEQYAKAANVLIPKAYGGIRVRFGFHGCALLFDSKQTEDRFRKGNFQGEGSFNVNGRSYLIAVFSGWVFKLTKTGSNRYFVENVNSSDQNSNAFTNAWVIEIPNGCIVNNGVNLPLYVTESTQRRTNPENGEIGIGQMGVYLHNHLFYVDQSGKRILVSDFLQPIAFTLEGTNIYGFACPDGDEVITAIGKQKSILRGVEGGNLIWSSNKDLYSADVRGTRSDWANLGSSVGKVSETIPGLSASSSYSFESFNTNIYMRSKQHGMLDIKQSEYQFINLDASNNQSIEASYFFDNDTDWMLDRCYTRACNSRLFTTVGSERNSEGYVYWNGLLSFNPAAIYSNQGTIPRRFESVFTGVRPWGMTSLKSNNYKDQLIIYSFDPDGVNRVYMMNEESNYDLTEKGEVKEIEGFIETRAYVHQSKFLLKSIQKRFYGLNKIDRSLHIKALCRPETTGEWTEFWDTDHLVGRTILRNGKFEPVNHKGQTRSYIPMTSERFSKCHRSGSKCMSVQYRLEFKGPIDLDYFGTIASLEGQDQTTPPSETVATQLIYNYRPDYNYNIAYKS